MTRLFRLAKHEDYGTVGLAPMWMPGEQADPLGGMGAAHDVLEHGPNDSVEWQGLGGSIWVRVPYYYTRGRGNPHRDENIASEFNSLFELWAGQDIPCPGKTRSIGQDDDELKRIVQLGKRVVREEAKYRDEESVRQARHWTRDEQLARMLGWMRRGYRAARIRWRGCDPYMLTEAFIAIEREADRAIKEWEAYEGGEVVLHYDVRRASARFELKEDRH